MKGKVEGRRERGIVGGCRDGVTGKGENQEIARKGEVEGGRKRGSRRQIDVKALEEKGILSKKRAEGGNKTRKGK